jgi:hypothetical protein
VIEPYGNLDVRTSDATSPVDTENDRDRRDLFNSPKTSKSTIRLIKLRLSITVLHSVFRLVTVRVQEVRVRAKGERLLTLPGRDPGVGHVARSGDSPREAAMRIAGCDVANSDGTGWAVVA